MKSVINYKKYTFNNYYIRNFFNLLTILHKVYFLFKNYEEKDYYFIVSNIYYNI